MKTATLKLMYGEAVLYEGVKLMNGSRQVGTADQMVVQEHYKGDIPEDLVVLRENGNLTVKRLLRSSAIKSPSGNVEFLVDVASGLEELSTGQRERFLTIYKMFVSAK